MPSLALSLSLSFSLCRCLLYILAAWKFPRAHCDVSSVRRGRYTFIYFGVPLVAANYYARHFVLKKKKKKRNKFPVTSTEYISLPPNQQRNSVRYVYSWRDAMDIFLHPSRVVTKPTYYTLEMSCDRASYFRVFLSVPPLHFVQVYAHAISLYRANTRQPTFAVCLRTLTSTSRAI